jgi:hypothetical protein
MKNEAQQESNQNDGTQQQLRRGKKNRNQNQ